MNEANELGNQIEEFDEGESGYRFDNTTKLTKKMFLYDDMRASSCCKVLKLFCNSKSSENIQNIDYNCFLWCVFDHKYKVDKHRERVSR